MRSNYFVYLPQYVDKAIKPFPIGGALVDSYTTTNEVDRAIRELGVKAYRTSPGDESRLHAAIIDKYSQAKDRAWLWEFFPSPSLSCVLTDYSDISEIVPDATSRIWFMVHEDASKRSIYDVTIEDALAIVGECFRFEYYLIGRSLEWILCENHHNRIFGSGSIVERLQRYAARHDA